MVSEAESAIRLASPAMFEPCWTSFNTSANELEISLTAPETTLTLVEVCSAAEEIVPTLMLISSLAELMDATGKKIIQHSAGPTWRHIDGSEVKAKVLAKQDASKPGAIPWLLLSATSHSGEGILGRVTNIQRIHTAGGVTPEAKSCDGAAAGKEVGVAYAADYYFYALSR